MSNSVIRVFVLMGLVFVFSFLMFMLLFLSPANADITRGCEGKFLMTIVGKKGENAKNNLDTFEGRGACKNKTQANTCRKRAMDNIFRCANDIWDNRWYLIGDPKDNNTDMVLPAICRGDTTGARKVAFKTNPHGRGTDIKYAMEYYACCKMQPGAGSLVLQLDVYSTGDKGCGKNHNKLGDFYWEGRTLIDDYKVNCSSVIKKGYCAVRTGG